MDYKKAKKAIKILVKLAVGLSPAWVATTIGGLLLWSVSWKVLTGFVLMFLGLITAIEVFRALGLFSEDGKQRSNQRAD